MPTYEYRCPEGHDFEQFVLRISAAKAELPCPTCGLTAPRRVSAGAGLVFKGAGFYITDYGKDGKKDQREAAKAGTAAPSGEGTGAAKSETAKSESAKSDSAAGTRASGDAAGSSAKSAGDAKASGKPAAQKSAAPSATPPKSGPAK